MLINIHTNNQIQYTTRLLPKKNAYVKFYFFNIVIRNILSMNYSVFSNFSKSKLFTVIFYTHAAHKNEKFLKRSQNSQLIN